MAFEVLISDNAATEDTIRLIIATVNQHSQSKFIQDLIKILKPEQTEDFLKRLFEAVCHYIKYQRDPEGHERIKTPKRLFADAWNGGTDSGGDCKKMTVAIASALKGTGLFEPLLKVISYDGKTWEHIYVICKIKNTWYILDPVNDCKFNLEIPHAKAVAYNLKGNSMNLSLLGGENKNGNSNGIQYKLYSGINAVNDDVNAVTYQLFGNGSGTGFRFAGCPGNDYRAQSMGLKNDYFHFTAEEAAAHILKVPLLALPRAAFLGLLYLGKLLANTPLKLHWAARLAKAWNIDKARVQKDWWRLGGAASADALRTAILKGSGVALAGKAMDAGQGFDYPLDLVTGVLQQQATARAAGMRGMGFVVSAATIAAITAAAPVVILLRNTLKDLGVAKEGETDAEVPDLTPPPTDPPAPPPGHRPPATDSIMFVPIPAGQPGSIIGKNVTLLALSFMYSQFPLYIFLPILAATLYTYRAAWKSFFNSITNKFYTK